MKKEQEEQLIEKSKKISIKEGSSYSVMDGFGLRYITPYALAIGASNNQIGLLSSIPSLFGNLSQLFTLGAMKKWSRKKIVFLGVFLQAIMWLFLIGVGSLYFSLNLRNQTPASLLIVIYTLLIFVGAFSGPAWTSWMKDLIAVDRGSYFGKRGKTTGIISIVGMLIAGFILDYFKKTNIFLGFIIIFFIAFLGRLSSSLFMLKQYEPKFKEKDGYYFSLLDFIKKMSQNNFGRFTIYYILICLAVNISSPFTGVYLLKNLGFSYVNYMIIILSSAISTLIFLPVWGRFADKYGNVKVMRICGPLTPFIPMLWVFSAAIANTSALVLVYLFLVEFFSGIVWAGFNLAAGNFIYDAVSRERMAICASYFNILSGFGVVIGATLGGFIASMNFSFKGITPILLVFILSAVLRLIVYLIMDSKINEVRPVNKFSFSKAKRGIKVLSLYKFFEYLDLNPTKVKHI